MIIKSIIHKFQSLRLFIRQTDISKDTSKNLRVVRCAKIQNKLPGSHIFFLLCLLPLSMAQAQIQTDGSLGSAQSLSGPDYAINEDLGRRAGNNLFHSFSEFNIHEGESAAFTGANEIANVISRVTGGKLSTINGLLKSEITNANLYFINPAGVLFGPNASLSINGSFHTSTADFIRLGDSDLFYSEPLQGEILSAAAPRAFGFFGASKADIIVTGSQLDLDDGATLSLVGGNVTIEDEASIRIPQGQINLVGVDSAGETVFDASAGYQDLDARAFARLNTVNIANRSELNVDGEGGGRIVIRGGQLALRDSALYARTTGEADGAGVRITADQVNVQGEVAIETTAALPENIGTIDLSTPELTLDGFGAEFQFNEGIGEIIRFTDGNIVLDGSLHPDRDGDVLTGPNYEITADMGQIAGNNLFHSFRDFFVDEGERAIFLGPETGVATISNIITRVTGENATNIYGGLTSDIPEADLYFINPNGLFFGPNATLNLPGSFHAGTADYLTFQGGGRFDASVPDENIPDGSDLRAYGFRNDEIGDITVEGRLFLSKDETFSLIGGNLQLRDNSRVVVTSGQVNLVSLQSTGEVSVVNGSNDLDVSGFSALGDIAIVDRSAANVTNADLNSPAGRIFVRGNDLRLDNDGELRARNMGEDAGGSIDVRISGDLFIGKESGIEMGGFGALGQISIEAENITIDGAGQEGFTGIEIFQFRETDGSENNLRIKAKDSLKILNGGLINTSTLGAGNVGSIMVRAKSLTIDGQGFGFAGIGSVSSYNATGDGGNLDIQVTEQLEITNGGSIDVSTFSEVGGSGGKVTVQAKNLIISNGSNDPDGPRTGILALSGANTTGNSGELTIYVEEHLQVLSGGLINTSTSGAGNAGTITVEAKALTIDGQSVGFAGIGSVAESSFDSDGGNIEITVTERFEMVDGGAISAFAETGNAGNLSISAGDDIYIENSSLSISAGQQNFDVNDLEGFQQPELRVEAGNSIRIKNSLLSTDAGAIGSERGAGGDIYLLAPTEIWLENSTLLAQAGYSGGNVFIDPIRYIVISSDVIAQADFQGGNYSVIVSISNGWIQSVDSLIDLSGEQSGSVLSNTSPFDLGAELSDLDMDFLNAEDWVSQLCEFRLGGVGSSFIVNGWKGVSNNADDFLPSEPILLTDYNFSEAEPASDEWLREAIFPELNDGCDDCP